jgi:hypothetical protein
MAAGVGGLQTALILIGFIIRFQPNFNNNRNFGINLKEVIDRFIWTI